MQADGDDPSWTRRADGAGAGIQSLNNVTVPTRPAMATSSNWLTNDTHPFMVLAYSLNHPSDEATQDHGEAHR